MSERPGPRSRSRRWILLLSSILLFLDVACGRHDAFERTIQLDGETLPVELELARAETLELWVNLTLRYPGLTKAELFDADLSTAGEFSAPHVVDVVLTVQDELGTRKIRCNPTSLRPGGGYVVRPEVVQVRGRMVGCDPQLQPGRSTISLALEPAPSSTRPQATADNITVRGAVVRTRRHGGS